MRKLVSLVLLALPLTVCGESITVEERPVVVRVPLAGKLSGGSALRLNGIQPSGNEGVRLRLFAENPAANRDVNTADPAFLGSVNILGGGGRSAKSVLVPVPASLLPRLNQLRSPRITIVPLSGGTIRIRSLEWLSKTE